ncbi:TPA: hypothetical protein ACUNF5_007541, partial [Burkholderia orbicola]
KIQQYIDTTTKSDSHTSEVQRAVNDRIAGVMNVSDYASLATAQADLARLRDLVAKVDAQPGLRVVKPWGTAPVVVNPSGEVVNPGTGLPEPSKPKRVVVEVPSKGPVIIDPKNPGEGLPSDVSKAEVDWALAEQSKANGVLDAAIKRARTAKKDVLADTLQAVREGRWNDRTESQVHTEADAQALVTAMGDLLAGKAPAMEPDWKAVAGIGIEHLGALAKQSPGLVTAMQGDTELANRLARLPGLPALDAAVEPALRGGGPLTAEQNAQMLARLEAQEKALPEQQ